MTTPHPPRTRSTFIYEAAADYAAAHTTAPDEVQVRLQSITAERTGEWARMQIGDDQALLLELLVRSLGAKRCVEVGTFTGYSALAISRGLAPGGRLLCCDVSEEWTSIARQAWAEAGVDDRIELRLAPAIDTLRSLPSAEVEPIDFAFIDADKTGYVDYYEQLVARLRLGGVLAADNTLQSGRVFDPTDEAPDTVAIRRFNDHVIADTRVRSVLLPIGDGVTLAQRVR